MITYLNGNLFDSKVQVLTNAINCVGVMGKGVALEFKNRYPVMHSKYVARCKKGEIKIGEPWFWEDENAQILNFPTKQHWRDPSSLEFIELGLLWLVSKYSELGIYKEWFQESMSATKFAPLASQEIYLTATKTKVISLIVVKRNKVTA